MIRDPKKKKKSRGLTKLHCGVIQERPSGDILQRHHCLCTILLNDLKQSSDVALATHTKPTKEGHVEPPKKNHEKTKSA